MISLGSVRPICIFSLTLIEFSTQSAYWGFWAHKRINRLAVFRLPAQMQLFYKGNIDYLTESAVNPDKRRYAVIGEAERHYIDLDVYGDSALTILPKHWSQAVLRFGNDSLRKHGIVPWYVQSSALQLTEAFKTRDPAKILRISADLGHYIADAHVPLHTTRNYNGQLTNEGIHGFWESRLPELFAESYDLWIGAATYQPNIDEQIWHAIAASHAASDSVFQFEKNLSARFKPERKYSFELRNNLLTRTYSREFSEAYHLALHQQVERRMRESVKMVGDVWYTCWVNAGQPDLSSIANIGFAPHEVEKEEYQEQSWLQRLFQVRQESDD